MYPFIKTKKETQRKIFNIFIGILIFLCATWFTLSGIELELSSTILSRNAHYVKYNSTAKKVEHINDKGKLFLETTETLEDSEISEYVHVPYKSGTYVVMNDDYELLMSIELTKDECIHMALQFIILDWLLFVIFVVTRINYRNSSWIRRASIFLMVCSSVFSWVVLSYWGTEVLKSNFSMSLVYFGRLAVVLTVELIIKFLVTIREKREVK